MLAQQLDVLPTADILEGEIDSDSEEASVVRKAGEIDDVSETNDAADSEDDADVTSVAARAQKIERLEHVVAAPPEPHLESRAQRPIS